MRDTLLQLVIVLCVCEHIVDYLVFLALLDDIDYILSCLGLSQREVFHCISNGRGLSQFI